MCLDGPSLFLPCPNPLFSSVFHATHRPAAMKMGEGEVIKTEGETWKAEAGKRREKRKRENGERTVGRGNEGRSGGGGSH